MTHRVLRLIVTLGLLTGPLAGSAQERGKMPREGALVAESASIFRGVPVGDAGDGLRGRPEHRDRMAICRCLVSRAVELAGELVRLHVDVIVAHHTPAVKASMNVTRSTPIVMSPAGAPLQAGLVKSLASPGGNVTGLSSMEADLATSASNSCGVSCEAFGEMRASGPKPSLIQPLFQPHAARIVDSERSITSPSCLAITTPRRLVA